MGERGFAVFPTRKRHAFYYSYRAARRNGYSDRQMSLQGEWNLFWTFVVPCGIGRGQGHMSLSCVSLWGRRGGQATSIYIPEHSDLLSCYQSHLGN